MFNIQDLKAAISGHGGFAKPNRFVVDFSDVAAKLALSDGVETASRDLNFMVDSITMPSRTLQTLEYSIWNHSVKIPHGYDEDEVNVVFNLTVDFYVKKILDEWHRRVINQRNYLLSYEAEYLCNVKIYSVDAEGKKRYGILLRGAYPLVVRGGLLDNNSESIISRIETTFTYKKFETIPENELNI